MIQIFRSIVFNYKHGGVFNLLKKTAWKILQAIFKYQWVSVYEIKLSDEPRHPKIDLIAKKLSFLDLERENYFKAQYYPETIKNRFLRQDECYGFYLNGKIAHIAWISYGFLEIANGFNNIPFENGIGIYDAYTLPDFRGKGVFSSALYTLQSILKDAGQNRLIIAVFPNNHFSRQAIINSGFHLRNKLFAYRFFMFSREINYG